MLSACRERLHRFEMVPDEVEHWEWRVLVSGKWSRLPAYVVGVLEGAIQSGTRYARVQLGEAFIFADLEEFKVALAVLQGRKQTESPHGYRIPGPWLKLTRYLRGHPSSKPDQRKKRQVSQQHVSEVQKVVQADSIHVSTLAGKVVVSMTKSEASSLHAKDLLQEASLNVGYPSHRLSLVHGDRVLETSDRLLDCWPVDGTFDLVLLVGEDRSEHPSTRFHEWIPEDAPGESSESLYAALRNKDSCW
mmetsp:Transcript_88650/g.138736  ORF Transcript_88650/g.138736 Transcript_88650/m.138736 type:complete len:247 (-) Transcript_88650:98-838(-)